MKGCARFQITCYLSPIYLVVVVVVVAVVVVVVVVAVVVNMVLSVHRNHKAYYGRGEVGRGYGGVSKHDV